MQLAVLSKAVATVSFCCRYGECLGCCQEREATLRADLARVTAERDAALSGESEAVRRAESAELGCMIAYRREPTSAEGDAHEAGPPGMDDAECFVPMGGWTGRRCRACGCWVWGGPTACERCVRREERDEARDQRDAARAQVRELQKVARAAVAAECSGYYDAIDEVYRLAKALPPSMLEEPSDG